MAELNEAILHHIESVALTPESVEAVVILSERNDVTDRQTTLSKELKDVQRRIQRMNAAIELSDDSPVSTLARLRELEARQTAIGHEMSTLARCPVCHAKRWSRDWRNGGASLGAV